jgi:hypothetical protein
MPVRAFWNGMKSSNSSVVALFFTSLTLILIGYLQPETWGHGIWLGPWLALHMGLVILRFDRPLFSLWWNTELLLLTTLCGLAFRLGGPYDLAIVWVIVPLLMIKVVEFAEWLYPPRKTPA